MRVKVKNITPEVLDQVAAEWEEEKIMSLIRANVVKLANEMHESRAQTSNLEMRAKIRAMRLYYDHKMSKKEIAELFGITTYEVTKWLK